MSVGTGLTASDLGSVALRYIWPGPRSRWLRRLRPRAAAWRFAAASRPLRAGRGEGVDDRLQRLEAVLFLARTPLSTRRLSQYANLADGTEARTLVRRLKERYDERGRAFSVEEVAGGFQLLTRPQFAPWLRRLEHAPPELRLSTPALETLSVVAYRQPVVRAEIESVRGVGCAEVLRQLMDRELVRISGRSRELGRPYLYATTNRFLQLFGLASLEQLPRVEAFREAAAAGRDAPPRSWMNSRVSETGQQTEESPVSVSPPLPLRSGEDLEPALISGFHEPRQNMDDGEEEYDYEEYDYEDEDEDEDDEYEDDYEDDYEDEDEEDEEYEDEWEEVGEDEDEEDEDWDEEDLDWEEDEEDEEEEEDDDWD